MVRDKNGSQLWLAKKGAVVEDDELKLNLSVLNVSMILVGAYCSLGSNQSVCKSLHSAALYVGS